jgi:hypothetical protein
MESRTLKWLLCAGFPTPVRFIRVARFQSEFRRISLCGDDRAAFHAYMRELLQTASQVESLSPEGPDHPNPEYPWADRDTVVSPLAHEFTGMDSRRSARMRQLLGFLNKCIELPALQRL